MKLSSARFYRWQRSHRHILRKNCCFLRGAVFEGSHFCPEEYFKHTQILISCPGVPRTLSNTQADDLSEGFASHYAPSTRLSPQLCPTSFIWESTHSSNHGPRSVLFARQRIMPCLRRLYSKYPLRTQATLYGHRALKETIVSLSSLKTDIPRLYGVFFDLLKAGQPPSIETLDLEILDLYYNDSVFYPLPVCCRHGDTSSSLTHLKWSWRKECFRVFLLSRRVHSALSAALIRISEIFNRKHHGVRIYYTTRATSFGGFRDPGCNLNTT